MPVLREAQKNTWGGYSTIGISSGTTTSWSGSVGAGDFMLQSGPGRLDLVSLVNPNVSGGAIYLYDAAPPPGGTLLSGGPFVLSGHKMVGVIPSLLATQGSLSGFTAVLSLGSYFFSMPFQSGLAISLKPSAMSYSVNWSPEPAVVP